MREALGDRMAIFTAFISIFALSSAYLAEYVFGKDPCILCLYERIPHFAILFLSMAAIKFGNHRSLLFLILSTYLVSSILAGFHVLVEQHLIEFNSSCTQAPEAAKTIEEEIAELLKKEAARCDVPSIVIFGLSAAAWNLILSIIMSILVLNNLNNKEKK